VRLKDFCFGTNYAEGQTKKKTFFFISISSSSNSVYGTSLLQYIEFATNESPADWKTVFSEYKKEYQHCELFHQIYVNKNNKTLSKSRICEEYRKSISGIDIYCCCWNYHLEICAMK
jgi:hypothetical protein